MGKTYKDQRRRFDDYSKKDRWNDSNHHYYLEDFENVSKPRKKRKVRNKELYMEENF